MDRAFDEGVPAYMKGEERGVRFYESSGFKGVKESGYWIEADG
jgi:hypothetical protein